MNMRMVQRLISATVAVASMVLCGADGEGNPIQRQTGGLVARDGWGRFVIVNRQHRIPQHIIRAKAEYLSRLLGIRVEISEREAADATVSLALAEGTDKADRAESEKGIVYVNALEGTNIVKSFNREFARVATGLFMPTGKDTQCSRSELEAVFAGESFTMKASDEVRRHLPDIGFSPAVVTTYRKACREGWAPEPVNDLQRAIRAEVLAEKERGPTNPILIPPPNARRK